MRGPWPDPTDARRAGPRTRPASRTRAMRSPQGWSLGSSRIGVAGGADPRRPPRRSRPRRRRACSRSPSSAAARRRRRGRASSEPSFRVDELRLALLREAVVDLCRRAGRRRSASERAEVGDAEDREAGPALVIGRRVRRQRCRRSAAAAASRSSRGTSGTSRRSAIDLRPSAGATARCTGGRPSASTRACSARSPAACASMRPHAVTIPSVHSHSPKYVWVPGRW